MVEPENLTLAYPRRPGEKSDRILAETDARLQAGMDRMNDEIRRIERRLGIRDA